MKEKVRAWYFEGIDVHDFEGIKLHRLAGQMKLFNLKGLRVDDRDEERFVSEIA